MVLQRSELLPGTKLRNRVSGAIGEVRASVEDEILPAHEEFVAVRVRNKNGKKKTDGDIRTGSLKTSPFCRRDGDCEI